jgi:hypothetical protein
MSSTKYVKEPPVLDHFCKNSSYWKRCIVNYLTIIDLWDIVDIWYILIKDDVGVLTFNSMIITRDNDNAVNAILNFISESVAVIFYNMVNAHDMWETLVQRYERNTQIKRSKITDLET